MFRDDTQKAAVCRVLLGQVGLGDLFTADGPTDELQKIWNEGGGEHEGDALLLIGTTQTSECAQARCRAACRRSSTSTRVPAFGRAWRRSRRRLS